MLNKIIGKVRIHGFAYVLAFALFLSLGMVNQTESQAAAKGKVQKVGITKPSTKTLVIRKGKTYKLKTSVKTSNKRVSKGLAYKSNKPKIATISKKGKIKGIKNGKATITVTSKVNNKKSAKLKVIVGSPVTKLSLNKKSVELAVGESTKLTTTLKPKKPSVKTVTWKTSNHKVAAVKKGTVKGVKEGKATITATANDGTGKKASCKITVGQKKTNLVSVQVTSATKVKVVLDGAVTLTKDDINITNRTDGTQGKERVVKAIRTVDGVNYNITLNSNILHGSFVTATIPSLTGTKSLETQYVKEMWGKDHIMTGLVGEWFYNSLWFENQIGMANYSITKGSVPEGLEMDAKEAGYALSFEGVPKKLADNQEIVVQANDELGRTKEAKGIFCIGDEKTIVVPPTKFDLPKGTEFRTDSINPMGGKYNAYYYKVTGALPEGVKFHSEYDDWFEDGWEDYEGDEYDGFGEYFYFSGKATGTSTTVKLTVVYKPDNIEKTVDVTFNVGDGYSAKGTARDASGAPLDKARVNLYSLDNGTTYTGYTITDGTFNVNLPKGNYAGNITYIPNPEKNPNRGGATKELEDFTISNQGVDGLDVWFDGEYTVRFNIGSSLPTGVVKFGELDLAYSKYEGDTNLTDFENGDFLEDGTYYFTIKTPAYWKWTNDEDGGYGEYMGTYTSHKKVVVNGLNQNVTIQAGDWENFNIGLNLTPPSGISEYYDCYVFYGRDPDVNDEDYEDYAYINSSDLSSELVAFDKGTWYLYILLKDENDNSYYVTKTISHTEGTSQRIKIEEGQWTIIDTFQVKYRVMAPEEMDGYNFCAVYYGPTPREEDIVSGDVIYEGNEITITYPKGNWNVLIIAYNVQTKKSYYLEKEVTSRDGMNQYVDIDPEDLWMPYFGAIHRTPEEGEGFRVVHNITPPEGVTNYYCIIWYGPYEDQENLDNYYIMWDSPTSRSSIYSNGRWYLSYFLFDEDTGNIYNAYMDVKDEDGIDQSIDVIQWELWEDMD